MCILHHVSCVLHNSFQEPYTHQYMLCNWAFIPLASHKMLHAAILAMQMKTIWIIGMYTLNFKQSAQASPDPSRWTVFGPDTCLSSVGRALDCSSFNLKSSNGRWFESGRQESIAGGANSFLSFSVFYWTEKHDLSKEWTRILNRQTVKRLQGLLVCLQRWRKNLSF